MTINYVSVNFFQDESSQYIPQYTVGCKIHLIEGRYAHVEYFLHHPNDIPRRGKNKTWMI